MIPAAILRQTVTVEPYEGETGAEGPSFGTPVTIRCLIQPRQRLLFGPNQRQVQSRAFLMTFPGTVIPPESRITHAGVIYRAIETFDVPGPTGASHVEVALG